VDITLAAILGNLLVSGIILTFYQRYYDFIVKVMNYLILKKRALILFVSSLVVLPILLLLL